jgi:hypothetical protein
MVKRIHASLHPLYTKIIKQKCIYLYLKIIIINGQKLNMDSFVFDPLHDGGTIVELRTIHSDLSHKKVTVHFING